MVELSRIAHQEPDLPLAQKKSEVILAKKTVLIGEVVNGGALPVPLHHTPVCSFDAQNRYRGEGPLAESTPSQFKGNCSFFPYTGTRKSLFLQSQGVIVCIRREAETNHFGSIYIFRYSSYWN